MGAKGEEDDMQPIRWGDGKRGKDSRKALTLLKKEPFLHGDWLSTELACRICRSTASLPVLIGPRAGALCPFSLGHLVHYYILYICAYKLLLLS